MPYTLHSLHEKHMYGVHDLNGSATLIFAEEPYDNGYQNQKKDINNEPCKGIAIRKRRTKEICWQFPYAIHFGKIVVTMSLKAFSRTR